MKRSPILLAAIAGLWLAAPQAHAAVITSGTSAPTGSYLSIGSSGGSNVRWQYTGATSASSHRDVGQLFKVSDSDIQFKSLTLQVAGDVAAGTAAANASFSISLYEYSQVTDAAPNGAYIHQEKATLPATINQGSYLTISLTTPVTLQANHYYAVIVAFDDPLSGQTLNWSTSTGSTYTDGGVRFFVNTQANNPAQSWTISNSNLYSFIGAEAIPEASHLALLFLGAGVILGRSQLKKRNTRLA